MLYYKIMDYAREVWDLTKLIGATLLTVAVSAVPFVYLSQANNEDLARDLAFLDKSPSVIFNSVAQCTAKGYAAQACEKSLERAREVAEGFGTNLAYSSDVSCQSVHRYCDAVSSVVYPNSVSTSYFPRMAAWQAAAGDLNHAVPLYTSIKSGVGIRSDKHEFNLK